MKYQYLLLFILLQFGISCKNKEAEQMAEKLDATMKNLNDLNKLRINDSIHQAVELSAMRDTIKAAQALAGDDFSLLYEQLKQSVFMVKVKRNDGIAQGTCFAIDNDGTCLSNYHVFGSNPQAANVISYNGIEYSVTNIIQENEEMDFIKFKVDTRGGTFVPVSFTSTITKVGEQTFTIGNPAGLSHTFSKGVISAIRGKGAYLQTTTDITHGSSGGPLFNTKGEVIGITTGTLGSEANLNIAVNIAVVKGINFQNNEPDMDDAARIIESVDASDANSFEVTSSRAYFHNQPNTNTIRQGYLVYREYGTILKRSGDFIYVNFLNAKGQRSTGWIHLADVEIK